MSATGDKPRRLSLTKKQLAEEAGAELLLLLKGIVLDGTVTAAEVASLDAWLAKNRDTEIPAVKHLAEIVGRIAADGVVSADEQIELQLGIEKVLPVSERRFAVAARAQTKAIRSGPRITKEDLKNAARAAEEAEDDEDPGEYFRRSPGWRGHPMTDRQKDFIGALGGTISDGANKGEASDLIDQLLREKPPTNRQKMVLRFWGVSVETIGGPAEVSEWMDAFYTEDPDRKDAWELFKEESGDDGRQGDPERVPFGAGARYLARIKGTIPSNRPAATERRNAPWTLWAIVLAIFAAAVLWVFNSSDDAPRALPAKSEPAATGAAEAISPSKIERPVPATNATPPQSSIAVAPQIPERRRINEAIVLRANGIIVVREPKVIVDGMPYAVGEVILQSRGLRPVLIDSDARSIRFEDDAGDLYTRTLK